ncbi:MAG: polyphosphate polymerase domain-containing protein [Fulvivirga sp.]|nr:polyphosphate polymerase domain-containing protein [Fulvivirga sp.]
MMDSLPDLDNKQALNLRYEYKMTAGNLGLQEVTGLLKRHPALFYEKYPPRKVNNIYFDTPAFSSYRDHIAGSAKREKLRIRWYGTPENKIERPVLERKMKFGQVGGKLSETLPSMPLQSTDFWPLPVNILHCVPVDNQAYTYRLKNTDPVVALRYFRHYFLSADARFRVTVDSVFETMSLTPDGFPKQYCHKKAPVIIELKYQPEDMDTASQITNYLPFRLTRFSKYIFSVENLYL